jgi:hypothetical protein
MRINLRSHVEDSRCCNDRLGYSSDTVARNIAVLGEKVLAVGLKREAGYSKELQG